MKIVVINGQTAFVRHWFRWFWVRRSGEDWRKLPIGQKYEKTPVVLRLLDELYSSGKFTDQQIEQLAAILNDERPKK